MSKVVWKFPVPVSDSFELDLPIGAEVLTVQVQRGEPQLWALVDPDAPKEKLRFRILGTGHSAKNADRLLWIATFQLHGGDLVFHCFQETGLDA